MSAQEEKRDAVLRAFSWLGDTEHSEASEIVVVDLDGGRFEVDPGASLLVRRPASDASRRAVSRV